MNQPEDPTSIPYREGERSIPPVEGAWSQMEKKLDLSMPVSPYGAGSGAGSSGAAPKLAIRLLRRGNVLRPWYGRIGMWAGVGAAAIAVMVVTRLLFPPVQGHVVITPPEQPARREAVTSAVRSAAGGAVPAGVVSPGATNDASVSGTSGRTASVSSTKDLSSAGDASSTGDASSAVGTATGGKDNARGGRSTLTPGGGAREVRVGGRQVGNVGGRRVGNVGARQVGNVGGRRAAQIGQNREAAVVGIEARGSGNREAAVVGMAAEGSGNREAQHNTSNRLIPAIRHSPGAVTRAFAGSRGTSPVKAADSLLRLAAVKQARGTIVLAGSHSNSRYRRIPRFSAGIAFKQYVPLPGQQFNDYGADGARRVYSDYIPAVFFRAAIDSRSYLQLGFGFHSPQYTRDMVIDNADLRNSTVTGYAAYLEFERDRLKKLFYNELDLTYHYRIADRWRAGIGIQYARLYGGTVESQTILQPANPALTDTVYATYILGMKNTSGYYQVANRRSEWRGIVELDYCWTRWMLGMRYQQAFGSFYFVIGSSAGQHVNNGALSIRASYALWERSRP